MDTSKHLPPHIKANIERRRTFAIISHPDAGKTTLTEKLLLYGGAIRYAGIVKAKGNKSSTTSDWMELEKQRGISISTSVLQFEYQGYCINLLDTPGHKDFSEDTYRTLMAADAAVMLIDAAKGIESQTRKLFEVCRMRGLPIFTFINKMDRPALEPLALVDEVEQVLGLQCVPITWPIGSGFDFKGVYDRQTQELLLFNKEQSANVTARLVPQYVSSIDSDQCITLLSSDSGGLKAYDQFKEEMDLLAATAPAWDHAAVLRGKLSPVFFGSAMNNFGVERFLQNFIQAAPAPGPRMSSKGLIYPEQVEFSGFIFKIQANTNPQFRDRIAFMRVCSGQFRRGMSVVHARSGRQLKLSQAFNFFGQSREPVEEAWPGDIVGLLDVSGDLMLADTLSSDKPFSYQGIPQFSPEHFVSVVNLNPMKRKQLLKGIEQLTQEGVVQLYYPAASGDATPILGAVGQLQFEIFKYRIESEYDIQIRLDRMSFILARWVIGLSDDINKLLMGDRALWVKDRLGQSVLLFRDEWSRQYIEKEAKTLQFVESMQAAQASHLSQKLQE